MQPLRHSSRPGCRPAFHSGDNSISARTKTKQRSTGRRPASSVRNLRGGGGGPPRAPSQIYSARGIERNTIILASGGPGAVPSTERSLPRPATRTPPPPTLAWWITHAALMAPAITFNQRMLFLDCSFRDRRFCIILALYLEIAGTSCEIQCEKCTRSQLKIVLQ
jgi:hypothetical protein